VTQSFTWAGYLVTGGPCTSVTGHWTLPRLTSTSGTSASAMWIGVDGLNDIHLLQAGTGQDVLRGRPDYFAWWEIRPAGFVRITSRSVRPGDRISATIGRVSTGRWRITISDARSGSVTIVRSYGGPGGSAEWMEEAPILGGQLVPLARHGPLTFDHGTLNGINPALVSGDRVALVRGGLTVSTPSTPDSDRDGFTLWQGSAAPAPPRS
jgi:hypothetical protein